MAERVGHALSPPSVRLRDVIEDDLPIFFEHQNDPAANQMAAFPARDSEAFMEHWTSRVLGDDTAVKRTIVVDEQVVGNIGSWVSDERLVGYWIRREHWGKGIASRACRCSSPTSKLGGLSTRTWRGGTQLPSASWRRRAS